MNTVRTLSLIALSALPFAAHAADLGLAKNFNAFIFGNYAANSDSEGAVAVGGNFTGNQNNAMHLPSQSPYGKLGTASDIGLYVGGNYNAAVNGNSQAKVYLANQTGGSVNNSTTVVKSGSNASLFSGMASDFATTVSNLKGQSAAINTLAQGANAVNLSGLDYTDQNHTMLAGVDLGTRSNLTFNVQSFASVGTFNGVTVYAFNANDLGLSKLSMYNPILTFNGLDATHTLLLNFTSTNVDFTPQIQTNSSNAYTLYNFPNATALKNEAQFTGSILAPQATLTQGSGNIQGNVIAQNFVQSSSELHYDAGSGVFQGYVPQAVPEPGTFALLGLGAAAMLRRRRK